MWENETSYKLSLKKNLIYEHCQDAYRQSQNYDVIFITEGKHEIPAHRIILVLSSGLIKACEDKDPILKIMLPEYPTTIVESFVQFLYSGEILIDVNYKEDFISLCKVMMVDFPELDHININAEETLEEDNDDEPNPQEDLVESFEVEELYETYSLDVEMKEEVEGIESSTAIKREEDQGSSSTLSREPADVPFDISYKPSSPLISETTVQKAITAIQQGENLMEIARKFGIPKSTLYRWKKKMETIT